MTPAQLNLRSDIRRQMVDSLGPGDRARLAAGNAPELEAMIAAGVEALARAAEASAALRARERARWN